MKCGELKIYWEAWLAGSAPAEVEQHLRDCARCGAQSAELRATARWLAAAAVKPPEASPAFWARLRSELEAAEQRRDSWAALALVGRRAAAALAGLVLLLALGYVKQASEPAVADFDAPQTLVEEPPGSVGPANGQLNRDQVVLTLVARAEPQP